jgi:hypothetical protein
VDAITGLNVSSTSLASHELLHLASLAGSSTALDACSSGAPRALRDREPLFQTEPITRTNQLTMFMLSSLRRFTVSVGRAKLL